MPDYERSFVAPRIFTDDHIERWADVYLMNPQVRARGVLFETFLLDPVGTLEGSVQPVMTVSRCGRLLPEQLGARRRADLDAALQELGARALRAVAAEAHCANGVWTEKLRHRAWPPRRRMQRKLMEM